MELHAESSKTVIFSQYLVLPPLAAMIAGITDSKWELISFRTLAMGADSQVVSRECFHIFIVSVLCEFSSRRSKSLTIEFLWGRGGVVTFVRLLQLPPYNPFTPLWVSQVVRSNKQSSFKGHQQLV